MIVIHATFPVDPDERERAVEHMQKLAAHSHEEDGVIEYEVAADIDDQISFGSPNGTRTKPRSVHTLRRSTSANLPNSCRNCSLVNQT